MKPNVSKMEVIMVMVSGKLLSPTKLPCALHVALSGASPSALQELSIHKESLLLPITDRKLSLVRG